MKLNYNCSGRRIINSVLILYLEKFSCRFERNRCNFISGYFDHAAPAGATPTQFRYQNSFVNDNYTVGYGVDLDYYYSIKFNGQREAEYAPW